VNFPSGLVDTPWGNFVFDTYGAAAYASYILLALGPSVPFGMLGAWLAGRWKTSKPERSIYWIIPLIIIAYFVYSTIPPFVTVILLIWGTGFIGGILDVRTLEIFQRRSGGPRGTFLFQAYFSTLLVAKVAGVGAVALFMPALGYAGLFAFIGIFLVGLFPIAFLLSRSNKN
jgi:hypothetical protein